MDAPNVGSSVLPLEHYDDGREVLRWIRHAAEGMGFEGVPERVDSSRLDEAFVQPGAYLVLSQPPSGTPSHGLAMIRRSRNQCIVIRPDGTEWRTTRIAACSLLQSAAGDVAGAALFAGLEGGEAAWSRVAEQERIGFQWLVVRFELDAAHPLTTQLRPTHFLRRLILYSAVGTVSALTSVGAAWTLGSAALTGAMDLGRIVAWCMLAASSVPLGYITSTLLGQMTLDCALLIKKRLLDGALAASEADFQRQGFGALLTRLNEASVIEQMHVVQLATLLTPIVQLVGAVVFFSMGALPGLLIPLLSLFIAGAAALTMGLSRRYNDLYGARCELTEELVDKIIGHRTRLVQENYARLHETDDDELDRYAGLAKRHDDVSSWMSIYPRLWVLSAGLVLLGAFVFRAPTGALIASAVATFLAFRGFAAIAAAARDVVAWRAAWRGIEPLFVAGRSRFLPEAREHAASDTVLSSVSFAYRAGARSVLSDVNLRLGSGERVLVEGPSGGGKSTLSKLLTGELRATSGTILVGSVAASPQFHENYIFSNTFGFNVDPRSLDGEMDEEAYHICKELGLEQLLAAMPSGGAQLLGETGWQLSHGERSRVFIARSLMQRAELVVFDESFAALDPDTLAKALESVRRRAKTLVVIAHT